MSDLTFPSLNSDQGTETADYLRNAANGAANAVCSLYANYPSGIIPDLGDPTGIGAFTDGLLNNLCRDRGQVPPPAQPPFIGGQCPVLYFLNLTWVQGSFSGSGGGAGAFGPISNYREVTTPGGKSKSVFVDLAVGTPNQQLNFRVAGGLGYDDQPGEVVVNFAPVRADGNPDNCGSPPPIYPVVPVPPSVYSPTYNIKGPGGTVSVPVTIIPTLIQPSVNFRPEINVKVGPINVNFNLGGIDFTLDNSGGVAITLPSGDSRPTKPPALPPKEPRPKECDLSGINTKLDQIKECACGKKKVLKNISYAAAKGRQVSLPSDTQYVVINSSPTNGVKYQVSEGNAPDVYHVGSASFGVGATVGERIPLNYANVGLEAPPRATSFAYSLVYGSTATITIYYLEDA